MNDGPLAHGLWPPRRGGVAQTSLLQNGLWANGCFVHNRLFGEHIAHRLE